MVDASTSRTKKPISARLFGGAAIALLIRVASAGLSFASMVAVSRWIGPDAYGAFAVMLTLGSFMGLAATAGLPTLALRAIPQIAAKDGRLADTHIRKFVGRSFRVVSGAGLLIATAMLLSGLGIGNPNIAWAALLVLPFAYAEHLAHVLRGLGQLVSALLPRDIFWYGAIVLLAVVSGGLIPGMSAIWTPPAPMAFSSISLILLVLMLSQGRQLLEALKNPQAAMRADAREVENSADGQKPHQIAWRSESFFLWLSTMAGASQRHLSIVLAAPFLTAVETGAFFAAHRTALLLSLPLIAANLVAAPLIARAWADSNQSHVQHLCKMIVLGASIPAVAGIAVIAFGGEWLLGLFDPAFRSATLALYIFTGASIVNALCGPTGGLMLMTGHEKLFVLIQLTTQCVSLILTMLGAAFWGLPGAALGASMGTIGWNVLVWLWCRRNIGIDPTIVSWISRPSMRARGA